MEEPRGRLGSDDIIPERQEGHLLKKRKWPLKGWHKVGWQGKGGATCGRLLDIPGFLYGKEKKNVCLFSPHHTPPALGCPVLSLWDRGTLCLRTGSSTMPLLDKM